MDTIRGLIELEPGGEPLLRGSHCTVAQAIQLQVCGVPDERILAVYPTLTREHLRAAAAYAANSWGIGPALPEAAVVAGRFSTSEW